MSADSFWGLILELQADATPATKAIEDFAAKTGQSVGAVEARIRDYNGSMKAAYDEAIQRSRGLGEETEHSMLTSRQSVMLLSQEMGLRLPRAVEAAISKVKELDVVIRYAGEALLTFFAMREMAEALVKWDTFKQKIGEILQPISELEVKVANFFGFLKDYSAEARADAERQKKDSEDQAELAKRVMDAQERLNAERATGVQKMRLESQAKIQGLRDELAHTDLANRAQFQRLIQLEQESEKEKERQYLVKQGQEADEKAQAAAKNLAEWQERVAKVNVEGDRQWYEAQKSLVKSIHDNNAEMDRQAQVTAHLDQITLAFTLNLEELGVVEQRSFEGYRQTVAAITPAITATKHLSLAKKELIMFSQEARKAEEAEVKAIQQHLAASTEQLTAGVVGLIAGRKAQAGVEALWETARGIQMLAEGTWPPNPAALIAAGLHFEAAAQYAVMAGSGGGRRSSSSFGGGDAYGGRGGGGDYGGRDRGDRAGGYNPNTLAPGVGDGRQLTVLVVGDHEAGQWMAGTLNRAVDNGVTLTSTTSQRGAPVGH